MSEFAEGRHCCMAWKTKQETGFLQKLLKLLTGRRPSSIKCVGTSDVGSYCWSGVNKRLLIRSKPSKYLRWNIFKETNVPSIVQSNFCPIGNVKLIIDFLTTEFSYDIWNDRTLSKIKLFSRNLLEFNTSGICTKIHLELASTFFSYKFCNFFFSWAWGQINIIWLL